MWNYWFIYEKKIKPQLSTRVTNKSFQDIHGHKQVFHKVDDIQMRRTPRDQV